MIFWSNISPSNIFINYALAWKISSKLSGCFLAGVSINVLTKTYVLGTEENQGRTHVTKITKIFHAQNINLTALYITPD